MSFSDVNKERPLDILRENLIKECHAKFKKIKPQICSLGATQRKG